MVAVGAMAADAATTLEKGRWNIVNNDDNTLTLSFDGRVAIDKAYAEVTYRFTGGEVKKTIKSSDLAPTSVSIEPVDDEIGTGEALTRVYTDGYATMTQTLNLYDNVPYIVAQVAVEPKAGSLKVESNRMIALASDERTQPLTGTTNNMIWVPFDNDGHGRYEVYTFPVSRSMTSHEVGCIYDRTTAEGFVFGSIDHDKWKSGITIEGKVNRYLSKLQLLSGYTAQTTRDLDWNTGTAIPHGYVKGSKVESARYLVGIFDDWRDGMEAFADACVAVEAPAQWDGGNPIGWSTWGVMQEYVNTPAVKETCQWIKDNLFDLGFHDKNDQTVVSLDSYCDGWGMSPSEISQLGNRFLSDGTYTEGRVKKEGLNQRLGMYGGMVIWEWSFDSDVPGTGIGDVPTYKWSDALLKYNGKKHRLFSGSKYYAIDPTHPAFYYNIESTLRRWSAYKVKYIKMDFINCGICEGDSWYDPEVTTGVMAYNYGMKIINEIAAKYDMYIVESMAPLFPYKWAHGRRTCCDRFSQLSESEYVMNAMSWAWWTDRLYAVNDPDQLVLHKNNYNHAETEGENRVRVTTGMCTGAFIIGDSFSSLCTNEGSVVGYPEESKAKALKMFGNADINAYVRENTGSFRPIDGGTYTSSQQTCYSFMRDTPDYVYVAIFNFISGSNRKGEMEYSKIGIDRANVKEIKELWSGESVEAGDNSFSYNVPGGDVKVFRLAKVTSGVDDIIIDSASAPAMTAVISGNECVVAANADMASVALYDMNGRCISRLDGINHVQATMEVNVQKGIYIVRATMADGTTLTAKVMNKA